ILWTLHGLDAAWAAAVWVAAGRLVTVSWPLLIFSLITAVYRWQLLSAYNDATVATAIVEKARQASSVREAVATVLDEIRALYGARLVLLAAHDRSHERLHLWVARAGVEPRATHTELQPGERATYFFEAPAVWSTAEGLHWRDDAGLA